MMVVGGCGGGEWDLLMETRLDVSLEEDLADLEHNGLGGIGEGGKCSAAEVPANDVIDGCAPRIVSDLELSPFCLRFSSMYRTFKTDCWLFIR